MNNIYPFTNKDVLINTGNFSGSEMIRLSPIPKNSDFLTIFIYYRKEDENGKPFYKYQHTTMTKDSVIALSEYLNDYYREDTFKVKTGRYLNHEIICHPAKIQSVTNPLKSYLVKRIKLLYVPNNENEIENSKKAITSLNQGTAAIIASYLKQWADSQPDIKIVENKRNEDPLTIEPNNNFEEEEIEEEIEEELIPDFFNQ